MITQRWNTWYIGCAGFAQLGRDDYSRKLIVEKIVINKIIDNKFPIPDEFKGNLYFHWNRNNHDFGTYYDLVAKYSNDYENNAERTDDDMQVWDRLCDWLSDVESYDWESEKIMDKCGTLYREMYTMEVVHQKNEDQDDDLEIMRRID